MIPVDMLPDAKALADYMSELSEDAWAAGWLMGLEYDLWSFMNSAVPIREYGCMTLGEAERERLRALSTRCAGWVAWDDTLGEVWVPYDAWDLRVRDIPRAHENAFS